MSDAAKERRDELASLYALGAIDAADHTALREELAATPALEADVRSLVQTAVGLSQAVPLVDPPAALRARVLTSITGKNFGPAVVPFEAPGRAVPRRASARVAPAPVQPAPAAQPATVVRIDRPGASPWIGWLAAAAALIVAIGTGMYALQLRNRVEEAEARAFAAGREVVEMRRVLDRSQEETRTRAHAGRRADRARHGARRSRRPAARAQGRGARVLEPIARHGLRRDVAAATARGQGLSVVGAWPTASTRSARACSRRTRKARSTRTSSRRRTFPCRWRSRSRSNRKAACRSQPAKKS